MARPWLTLLLVGMRLPLTFNFAMGWLQPVLGLHDMGLWFLLLYLLKLDEHPRLARLTRQLAIISVTATSLDGLITSSTGATLWLHPGRKPPTGY